MPPRFPPGPALLGILALTALLRLGAVFAFGVPELHGDEGYYVRTARSLAEGRGHPGSERPPGYPFFMSLAFRAGGGSLTAARLAQVPVSLLAVLIVFDLVRRRFGERPALVSALLCAIHPELVHYSHFLWAETLFATEVLLAFWLLDRFDRSQRVRWLAAAGACLGFAALTKEWILLFAVVIAGWVAAGTPGPPRQRVGNVLLLATALALVVLPWTWRNYRQHGRFLLVASMHWGPVAYDEVEASDGSLLGQADTRRFRSRYFGIPDEFEREAFARATVLESVAARQPGWLPRKAARNLYMTFTPWGQMRRFETAGWFAGRAQAVARALAGPEAVLYAAQMALGLLALWLVPGDRLKQLVVWLVLFFVALHVLAAANHRYRVVLLPLLAAYAGPLLCGAARRGAATWRKLGAVLSLAVLGAVLAAALARGPEFPPARTRPGARAPAAR